MVYPTDDDLERLLHRSYDGWSPRPPERVALLAGAFAQATHIRRRRAAGTAGGLVLGAAAVAGAIILGNSFQPGNALQPAVPTGIVQSTRGATDQSMTATPTSSAPSSSSSRPASTSNSATSTTAATHSASSSPTSTTAPSTPVGVTSSVSSIKPSSSSPSSSVSADPTGGAQWPEITQPPSSGSFIPSVYLPAASVLPHGSQLPSGTWFIGQSAASNTMQSAAQPYDLPVAMIGATNARAWQSGDPVAQYGIVDTACNGLGDANPAQRCSSYEVTKYRSPTEAATALQGVVEGTGQQRLFTSPLSISAAGGGWILHEPNFPNGQPQYVAVKVVNSFVVSTQRSTEADALADLQVITNNLAAAGLR